MFFRASRCIRPPVISPASVVWFNQPEPDAIPAGAAFLNRSCFWVDRPGEDRQDRELPFGAGSVLPLELITAMGNLTPPGVGGACQPERVDIGQIGGVLLGIVHVFAHSTSKNKRKIEFLPIDSVLIKWLSALICTI